MKSLLDNKEKIIACLIVSCLIWLIKALSQDHTTTIRFPVVYQNLPNDLVMVNTPPNHLTISLQAKGTELLRHKYKYWEEQTLFIDYAEYRGENRIRTKDLVESFSSQLKNVKLSVTTPKVIRLAFEKKISKQIPIYVPMKFSVANDFEITDTVTMPEHVVITGPISLVDTISVWHTDSLILKNVTQTRTGTLTLQEPSVHTLQFSKERVEYMVTVEEFTEKELTVPIVTMNVSDTLNILLYKGQANIQFQVSINDFRNINASAFSIIADFANVDILNDTEVPLHLIDTLPEIKNLRITPAAAEYVIIEKAKTATE